MTLENNQRVRASERGGEIQSLRLRFNRVGRISTNWIRRQTSQQGKNKSKQVNIILFRLSGNRNCWERRGRSGGLGGDKPQIEGTKNKETVAGGQVVAADDGSSSKKGKNYLLVSQQIKPPAAQHCC